MKLFHIAVHCQWFVARLPQMVQLQFQGRRTRRRHNRTKQSGCSGRKCPYGCSAASFEICGIRSTIRSRPTHLARFYYRGHSYAEAESVYKHALSFPRKFHGAQHEETANAA